MTQMSEPPAQPEDWQPEDWQQPPQHPQPWQYPQQPQYAQYPQSPRRVPAAPATTPEPGFAQWRTAAPRALHPVLGLLALNLLLSVALTVVTLATQRSLIGYQLDHRHILDPAVRASVRNAYTIGLFERVFGNVVVSIVYAFLARALIRGRRWAYRRVLVVGIFGVVALAVIQFTPYPPWMRVEQGLQACVLAAMVFFATRPAVRAHFDPRLPGRTTRRFNR